MKNSIFSYILIILTACQTNSTTELSHQEVPPTAETNLNSCESMSDAALIFIQDYVDYCNLPEHETTLTEWVEKRNDVTMNFINELNKILHDANVSDPELGLGFDPLLNAQDYPEQGFEIFSCDTATNIVEVSGIDYAEFKVKILLVQENNIWKIDGCGVVNI